MSESQDREQGIQNDFFNEARRDRTRLSIFLTNGKRLAGRIKSFDRFAIVIDAGGGSEEMIFKHAIATIAVGAHRPEVGGQGYRTPRPAVSAASAAAAVPSGTAATAVPSGSAATAVPSVPAAAEVPSGTAATALSPATVTSKLVGAAGSETIATPKPDSGA